jgi:hypothetical protein
MAVDIRFYDTNLVEMSFDKLTGGIDFGVAKKGQAYTLPVVVKNVGSDPALNVSVKGSPLNSPADVSAEAYANEVLASKWKSFSKTPTGQYALELNLPNIPANSFMTGIKERVETFSNPLTSAFIPSSLAGATFQWTGSSLICKDGAENDGKIYTFAEASGWGDNLEQDCQFIFDMPQTTTSGAAFIMFHFRKNCLGDERGYLVNIKRACTVANPQGTFFFEIRKGAGVRVNGSTDFGTILATTPAMQWFDNAKLRIKCFTNENNLPEIKIWYKDVSDNDAPINFGTGVTATSSWVDTADTYKFAGKVSIVFGSGGTGIAVGTPNQYEIKDAVLNTVDPEGKIYVRTIVGEGSSDGVEYSSALELSYDPVE